MQSAFPQICCIDVGDFEFSSRGRAQIRGDIEHSVVEEIQSRHCVRGFWRLGFLLDALDSLLVVEFDNAVAFRVFYVIGEDGRATSPLRRGFEQWPQSTTIEDVVPEHQRRERAANKIAADNEGLRQPFGPWLLGILETHSKLTAVAEQRLKARQILRR